jgi:hypothetical protein
MCRGDPIRALGPTMTLVTHGASVHRIRRALASFLSSMPFGRRVFTILPRDALRSIRDAKESPDGKPPIATDAGKLRKEGALDRRARSE